MSKMPFICRLNIILYYKNESIFHSVEEFLNIWLRLAWKCGKQKSVLNKLLCVLAVSVKKQTVLMA